MNTEARMDDFRIGEYVTVRWKTKGGFGYREEIGLLLHVPSDTGDHFRIEVEIGERKVIKSINPLCTDLMEIEQVSN